MGEVNKSWNVNFLLTPLVLGCVLVVMFLPNWISIYEQRSIGDSAELLPAWHYAEYGLTLQIANENMHVPYHVFANLQAKPFELARLCKGCGDVTKETKYGYDLREVLQEMGISFSQVKANPFIWFIGADGYTQVRDFSGAKSWADIDDVVSVTAGNLPKKADNFNTPIGFFNLDEFAHDDVKDGSKIALREYGPEGNFFATPEGEIPEIMLNPMEKPEYHEASFELKVFVNGVEQEPVTIAEIKEHSTHVIDKGEAYDFVPLDYFIEKYEVKDATYLELFAYDSYAWHAMERLGYDDLGFTLSDSSAQEFGSPVNFYVPRDKNYPIGKAGMLKGNLKIEFR